MEIRDQVERIPIEVSSRILRHIGRGIYRTPAAALKEMVSNSYDARATEVTIDTGYPVFERMVISDNGDGMTREAFARFVRNIGFTDKVAGEKISMPGSYKDRRTIGHFGIGLLAIGQLAKKAVIASKVGGAEKGFSAEIDFEQFEVRGERGYQRAVVIDETVLAEHERSLLAERGPDAKLPIGICKIRDVRFKPEDRKAHFTRVELQTTRLEVKKKLSGEIRDLINPDAVKTQKYSASFEELLELIRMYEWKLRQGQYPYERLLWELSVYCPVPYKEIGPFGQGKPLRGIYEIASQYAFSVKIDGFKLSKPLEASFFKDEEYPVEQIFEWNNEVYMDKKKNGNGVSGYLIYKRKIRPNMLQGILIRSGGVAIGLYDTTYLEYPFYEGFKFNQMTGELFVEGLAGALNIDRNSFNETDDNYIALANWLHAKLQSKVFPKIKVMGKEISAKPRAENIALVRSILTRLAQRTESACAKIGFENRGKKGPLFKVEGGRLIINQEHPDGSGSGARIDKLIFSAALILTGKVSPGEVEELQEQIGRIKTEVRKGGSSS